MLRTDVPCGRPCRGGQTRGAAHIGRRFAPSSSGEYRLIGLEPSCLFTLRDEFTAMLPGEETDALAGQAQLLEEFLAEQGRAE